MANTNPQLPPSFNGVTPEQASQNPKALERYLHGIGTKMLVLNNGNPVAPATVTTQALAAAPANPLSGSVVAQDGVFNVTLSPAWSTFLSPLLYQLQTSDTLAFDAAGNVITYGGDGVAQTTWKLHEPNATRYIRWRAKTANSSWTAWTYYVLPSACGPYALWSGVLRSIANSLVNQSLTPSGSNPLSQSGTSTAIVVAASQWKAGSQVISYNGGTVDPGAYGLWAVYCLDPKRAGGSVVFLTTQDASVLTSSDYIVWFGNITTASGGGGTGGGGGGGGRGTCPMGEVRWRTPDGGTIKTSDLTVGSQVKSIDGGVDTVTYIESVPDQPCISLTLENGMVFQGGSSSHMVKYNAGPFGPLFEMQVGDVLQTEQGPSAIQEKNFIGNFTVYMIHLDRTRVGWTDGIVSHNYAIKTS